MFRIIINLTFIIFVVVANAQNTNYSPYSRFAVGNIPGACYAINAGLAGTGIAIRDSNHLNFANPASYSAQSKSSFIFEFGFNQQNILLTTSQLQHSNTDFAITYLAAAFPVTKNWFTTLGLTPFSKVGYDIFFEDNNFNTTTKYYYYGSGGIDRFYIGNSYKILPNLSLGFNTSYLFGYLKNTNTIIFPNDNSLFNFQAVQNITVNDLYFDYGLQYIIKFNEKWNLITGIKFENKTDINASRNGIVATIDGNDKYNIEENTIIDTLRYYKNNKGTITLPMGIGGGFCLRYSKKVILAADYKWQNWKQFNLFNNVDSLTNNMTVSFGAQYLPSSSSEKYYWKKINYRIGARYSNTFLTLNDMRINDVAFTLGLKLPLLSKNADTRTSFNIAFEAGKRGNINNNLIKETYSIVSFGITLYEWWFYRPKIQ